MRGKGNSVGAATIEEIVGNYRTFGEDGCKINKGGHL
jgi:hypothetical protein